MLLEERFYGYYLHGKSVHAHADADLLQLNSNLKREEVTSVTVVTTVDMWRDDSSEATTRLSPRNRRSTSAEARSQVDEAKLHCTRPQALT